MTFQPIETVANIFSIFYLVFSIPCSCLKRRVGVDKVTLSVPQGCRDWALGGSFFFCNKMSSAPTKTSVLRSCLSSIWTGNSTLRADRTSGYRPCKKR